MKGSVLSEAALEQPGRAVLETPADAIVYADREGTIRLWSFSGGTLERPALKRLLADIEQGLVDVIIVYKIERHVDGWQGAARLRRR